MMLFLKSSNSFVSVSSRALVLLLLPSSGTLWLIFNHQIIDELITKFTHLVCNIFSAGVLRASPLTV